MGNEKFQGNIYVEPEPELEDRTGFAVRFTLSHLYDLYKIRLGFSFLVSKLGNLPKYLNVKKKSLHVRSRDFLVDRAISVLQEIALSTHS